jgi:single-stranded DNA-binding protein
VLGKNPEDQHPGNVKKFLHRGSHVQVTGRISENKWQHRETGDWRSRTEIVASSVQFLGSLELRTSTGAGNSNSDDRVLEPSVVEQGN